MYLYIYIYVSITHTHCTIYIALFAQPQSRQQASTQTHALSALWQWLESFVKELRPLVRSLLNRKGAFIISCPGWPHMFRNPSRPRLQSLRWEFWPSKWGSDCLCLRSRMAIVLCGKEEVRRLCDLLAAKASEPAGHEGLLHSDFIDFSSVSSQYFSWSNSRLLLTWSRGDFCPIAFLQRRRDWRMPRACWPLAFGDMQWRHMVLAYIGMHFRERWDDHPRVCILLCNSRGVESIICPGLLPRLPRLARQTLLQLLL